MTEGDDDPRDPPYGKQLTDIGEVGSPMYGHTDEIHPITEQGKAEFPSEKKELLELNQEHPILVNGSSLQQSETSKSSRSSSSSSDDEEESHHSHAISVTELITGGGYTQDDHCGASAFLEAAQDPDGIPPFQDLDLPGTTEMDLLLLQDLGGGVSSDNSISLTDDEENDIVPEAIHEVEQTVTITESQVKVDESVSATAVPSEDFQSCSVVYANDLKGSSWISCCGLFEFFSGSNR